MTQRDIVRALLRLTRPLWKNRRFALLSEEIFWGRWMSRQRDRMAELLAPDRPFPPELFRYVEHVGHDPIDVLEVGAGPFTAFGASHPTRRFNITPTDVLAPRYDRLLARRKIDPPLRTIHADAERLVAQFGAGAFDLVFAANCVDHMERPLLALGQMISVARKGAFIVLNHEVNEGVEQEYAGLHQWNLNEEGGHFIIWNEEERHDVTELLRGSCEVGAAIREGILYTEIRKLTDGVIVIS